MAFGNEQKDQKYYLDCDFNTVIYHIVTSLVAFNIGSKIKIQHNQEPWLYKTLTHDQYKKILSPHLKCNKNLTMSFMIRYYIQNQRGSNTFYKKITIKIVI